ncbi:MAG: UDPglucose 6-dehydrogenase [Candidatus Azotimanducaceae bacterium]|jgi:UDPglucose 6-dehydrogenase
MNIVVVGSGYVGLVTGTCFAEMGNYVTCIDIDMAKLAKLQAGIVPMHEPGLEEMIRSNVSAERLTFSADLKKALERAAVVFIAVGTPPNEDGSADLSHVLAVAKNIGNTMARKLVVVDKSTVPVGTADLVKAEIESALARRGENIAFDVVSNPEFLKEGAAIKDFMTPDRIVIGTTVESSRKILSELYAPFSRNHDKMQFMGVRDAEMTKYAANAMLATRISFMNEIAMICEHYGVDVENVRRGIGSDTRIGYSFLYSGVGYGGSCFPKDVRALIEMASIGELDPWILKAVDNRNKAQKASFAHKVHRRFGSDLSGKKFAIWGLSFKPDTDDIRESPAIELLRILVRQGAEVATYDPKAMDATYEALTVLERSKATFCKDSYDPIDNADALIVMTEWKLFKQPDFEVLAAKLKEKVIFDGRNIYDPATVAGFGLDYIGVGRQAVAQI